MSDGNRFLEMVMSPNDLVVTDFDKQAACDLIGTDTYDKPVWIVETISPCNRVVQAFAKYRVAASLRARAAMETTPETKEG